jgi:hypothetical protein
MRRRAAVAVIAGVVILGLVSEAAVAADFSPSIQFGLSNNKADANPSLGVSVAQDDDEEELDSVEIRVPAGFKLATDGQIPNGTRIGSGQININAGPGCRPGFPSTAAHGPILVPVNITEQDRTPAEASDGVIAVFVVDLRPVTTIPLKVRGSPDTGYTLGGTIPPNDNTCPPFQFNASFFQQAAGVPILVNPKFGGQYVFSAKFVGQQGSVSESQQVITIDGPSKASVLSAKKKKCRRFKNKKRRRRCRRRQKKDSMPIFFED